MNARAHRTEFGPFRLFPAERRLLKGETPLQIGSREFDILIALVERAGEVVTKRELFARVWPDVVVEEAAFVSMSPDFAKCLPMGKTRRATSSTSQAEAIPSSPPLPGPSAGIALPGPASRPNVRHASLAATTTSAPSLNSSPSIGSSPFTAPAASARRRWAWPSQVRKRKRLQTASASWTSA